MTKSRLFDALIAFMAVATGSYLGMFIIEGRDYSFTDNWLQHALYGVGSALVFLIFFPLFTKREKTNRTQKK
ncbi:hypothetical protein ACE1TH_06110 [Shouchella sp. JSM 1781072]|uniref:hypothetical protein n=1 Tax=Shouchella sp. JSM 1781072 TaxID=3344581 RepID=UPI0035BF393B